MNGLLAAILDFLQARNHHVACQLLVVVFGCGERVLCRDVQSFGTTVPSGRAIDRIFDLLDDCASSSRFLVSLLIVLPKKGVMVCDVICDFTTVALQRSGDDVREGRVRQSHLGLLLCGASVAY